MAGVIPGIEQLGGDDHAVPAERAPPEAGHPAVQQHDEPADRGRRGRPRRPRPRQQPPGAGVAHHVLVVALDQVDDGRARSLRSVVRRFRGGRPQREAACLLAPQPVAGAPDRGADLRQRQARPPGQVLLRRRAVPGEEAHGQFHERRVARQVRRAGRPLLEQHGGVLTAAPRTAADDGRQLGAHEQVRQALALGGDARLGGDLGHLGTCEGVAAAERRIERRGGAVPRRRVEPELLVAAPVSRRDPRRRRRQEPADVGREHEVPRGPQQVGAQDPAGRERLLDGRVRSAGHAGADGPRGRPVVLRLHPEEPADGRLRRGAGRAGQALRAQPARHDPFAQLEVHPRSPPLNRLVAGRDAGVRGPRARLSPRRCPSARSRSPCPCRRGR